MNRGARQPADIQQTPPHSEEAEKGVLSSMLQSNANGHSEAIATAIVRIDEEQFYVPANKTLFVEIRDLYEAGTAFDLITFTQHLRDRKLLDSLGGAAAVTALYNFVPSPVLVNHYIDIVRDKYARREAIASLTEGVRRLQEDQDDNLLSLDEIESKLTSIRSLHGKNGADAQDAVEALRKPIVTPPDVIEGVLHQGGKASFGGASKSRKTWLLLDIAIAVASGEPWFIGFPTHKGRVLYVNFELPAAFCWKRIRAICDERQITLEPGMLKVWNLRGRVHEWPRLQQQIRSDEYALIIIDPVYKLLLLVSESIRDEIRTGGVATVLDQMESLAVRTGAAVAFGAHFAKGNQAQKESIDRVSGSGVWARDPDSIINFTAHKTEDCYAVEMDLRNHAPQKPFVVRWEYPVFARADELNPKELKQAKGAAEKQFTVAQIVEAVADCPALNATQFVVRIERKLKTSNRTAWRLFDEAKEADAVRVKKKLWKVNKQWKPAEE